MLPTIFRSTDTSAPVLTGSNGDLVALLDACLRTGYGSQTGLGWTKPYTTTNGAAFKQPAGSGMYLQVLDSGSLTGLARDAACNGFETMSAWNTGTGQFPTAAQNASLVVARKSATADATARAWLLVGDDRTFYLFVLTGDSAGCYVGFGFGDIYSTITGDSYKCAIIGHGTSQTAALTTHGFGQNGYGLASGASLPGHWVPRNYSGVGGSTNILKFGDTATIPVTAATNPVNFVGVLGFPNPSDGGLYAAPIRLVDGSTPGTTVAGTFNLRGRMRGLWHPVHAAASFADGDTAAGTGDFAGRSFTIVKSLMGSTVAGMILLETTAWDTSA